MVIRSIYGIAKRFLFCLVLVASMTGSLVVTATAEYFRGPVCLIGREARQ
jgi:hypothetical protein